LTKVRKWRNANSRLGSDSVRAEAKRLLLFPAKENMTK
jgi:hypothetical protein